LTMQMRSYTIAPGLLAEWVERWRSEVVPLRLRHGFRVPAAWVDQETEQHIVC
jgi:ribosomal protein L11 methylase PrmA